MAFPFRKKTDEEKAAEAARAEQSKRLRELEKAAKRQQKAAKAANKQQLKEDKAATKKLVKAVKTAEKQQREAVKADEKQRKKEAATLERAARRADKRARREIKREAKAAKRARAKAAKAAKRRRPAGRSTRSPTGPAPFAKREHCHACARAFTPTRRRHHCRLCRASVCLSCLAATRHALPLYTKRRPQKVCVVCELLVLPHPEGEVALPVAPPVALPAALPQMPPSAADNSLAAPLVRLAVSGRSTKRPSSAPLPDRSAPVVRVRRPPSSTPRPSRWTALKRKASASRLRWGEPQPVGRRRLDVHLAKTAELLARGSSRAIELRVEQPHDIAVAV